MFLNLRDAASGALNRAAALQLRRYVAQMLIRSATVEDAPAIGALVTACAREHIASSLFDGGLSHLLSEMTTENQAKRIRNGCQYFVALESDTLRLCSWNMVLAGRADKSLLDIYNFSDKEFPCVK